MENSSSGTCDAEIGSGTDTERRSVPRYLFGYEFILPNKSRDHVLGEVLANGIAKLPGMELPLKQPRDSYPTNFSDNELEAHAETKLGIHVHIVRELSDTAKQGVDGIGINHMYLGNVLSDESLIKEPFEWIHRDPVCTLKWISTNKDDVTRKIKMIFEEMNGERLVTGVKRWEEIGWFEEVTGRIRQMLETREMVVEGKIRKVPSGTYNHVMRFEVKRANNGEAEKKKISCEVVFVKCISPLTREVERTVAAAGVLGDIAPEIIGVDKREGILMQRNGGEVTDGSWDHEALFDTISHMQVLSMNNMNELEEGGFRIRDSEWVDSNLESILDHKLLEEYGNIGDMNKGIVAHLRSQIPEIKEKCRRITKLGLPRTIVHGDLGTHNIGSPVMAYKRKVYRIFDWASSFIGNPLHGLEWLRFAPVYISPNEVIDAEQGFRQVCKHWKVCSNLTLDEMNTVLDMLGSIAGVIEIQALAEQFDACKDSNKNEKDRILGELDSLFGSRDI